MGNCVTRKPVQVQDKENESEENPKVTRSPLKPPAKLNEDGLGNKVINGEMKNGVRRIRLVVTQEELQMILNSSLHISPESWLMRAAAKSGKWFSGVNHSWRPALECIPEEA